MKSKPASLKKPKMSEELENLNQELTLKKVQQYAVGVDIHQCSNSLKQAKVGSKEEDRLIKKILAYQADYQVYEDEIKTLEKRIRDKQYPPVSKNKGGWTYKVPSQYDFMTYSINTPTTSSSTSIDEWSALKYVDYVYQYRDTEDIYNEFAYAKKVY